MYSQNEDNNKVLTAYAEGSPLTLIEESFNVSQRRIIHILHSYREEHREKKSFADDFKKLVAERDINGGKDITRSSIAQELGINPNTVKKFCEEFGQALKERATNDRAFTKIDGDFTMKACPSCNSKKVNVVDENTIYCKKCGDEHEIHEGYALKVNFEYLDE